MIKTVQSPSEIQTVSELAHQIWNQHYVPIIGQAQVDYMVDKFQSAKAISAQIREGYLYLLISIKEIPAGYMALVPDAPTQKLMISKLYVNKEFRGSHLGQQLLLKAEEIAKEQKAQTLWLTVNKDNRSSINWYQAHGFQIKDKVEFDIGNGFIMDDYLMEKSL